MSEVIVWSDEIKDMDDSELIHTQSDLKTKITNAITEFGKSECDALIGLFGLTQLYKDKYEDRNIMYNVKYQHDEQEKRWLLLL